MSAAERIKSRREMLMDSSFLFIVYASRTWSGPPAGIYSNTTRRLIFRRNLTGLRQLARIPNLDGIPVFLPGSVQDCYSRSTLVCRYSIWKPLSKNGFNRSRRVRADSAHVVDRPVCSGDKSGVRETPTLGLETMRPLPLENIRRTWRTEERSSWTIVL